MGSNKYKFLLWFFMFSIIIINAQPSVQVNNNGAGYVTYTTGGVSDDALRFYIFGDGYYSFQNNATHQFPAAPQGYNTKVYFSEKYDPEPPALVSAYTGPTASGSSVNPSISINGNVDIITSWAPVKNMMNYNVLVFKNTTQNTVSGCLEFYYKNEQANLELGILEYNNWVTDKNISNINIAGYNRRIKWNYSNMNPNEIRLVYIPISSKLGESNFLNFGIRMSNGCTPPNASNIQHKNIQVKGTPHDPNYKFAENPYIYGDGERSVAPQSFTFTIKFKNLGDYFAEDVTIVDNFQTTFDMSTFEIIASEYPFTYNVSGQNLTINFNNIYLPGTKQIYPFMYSEDQTESWIKFKVCSEEIYEDFSGDCFNNSIIISNIAQIFFDDEPPVLTNEAKIYCQLGEEPICSGLITVKRELTIEKNYNKYLLSFENFKNTFNKHDKVKVELFNVTGFKMKSYVVNSINDPFEIDLNEYPAGIYLAAIKSSEYNEVIRLVKN